MSTHVNIETTEPTTNNPIYPHQVTQHWENNFENAKYYTLLVTFI